MTNDEWGLVNTVHVARLIINKLRISRLQGVKARTITVGNYLPRGEGIKGASGQPGTQDKDSADEECGHRVRANRQLGTRHRRFSPGYHIAGFQSGAIFSGCAIGKSRRLLPRWYQNI